MLITIKDAISYLKCCVQAFAGAYGRVFAFVLCMFLFPYTSFAQKEIDAVDELSVTLDVKGLGEKESPALMRGKQVYLSVNDVFDFLKVKNIPNISYDSVAGFFIEEKDVYLVDQVNNRILYKDKINYLQPNSLLISEGNLFLDIKYFQDIFGLDADFNFRRLWVSITSNTELPAIREARLEQMRKNLSHLTGTLKADTTLKRSYPLFHLGAADWAVFSTQQSQGASETRASLGLGGVLLGGETNANLNYYSNQPLTEKQQFYQWRFVNNDNAAVRQVVAGKVFTQAIASLYAPLLGVQVNNIPTIQRRSYGKYTLSNTTEPGWIVELYINEVLVDYKKADASGFYTFDVPLIYGYSALKLRFYGPYGEERTSQQYVSVPFNFLPAHEFEYAATAGIVQDGQQSKFGRISSNYGLSNHITVGGGFEYLSSVTSGPEMPFINTSLRIASNLLLTGEYTNKVRSRALLSYRMPSNLQFDLDYTKFAKGQTAIYYNYLEERKASITLPFRVAHSSIFSRVAIDQIILPVTKYTNAELSFSGAVKRVGLNLTSYASISSASSAYFYSIFSFSFMLPKKIYFTSQSQYNYRLNNLDFMKFTFERSFVGKSFLNLSYQEYFTSNNRNILLGFRYDLSFARVSLTALAGNKNTYSRVESASGSFLFDGKTGYVNANNRSNVGRGGIVVQPFLDMNCNGVWDKGEPRAPGLKLHVNGGRTVYSAKDTVIRIFELEPYNSYIVDLERNSFDYVSWQMKHKTIKVTITPNNFTNVEVPVAVAGEVLGNVSLKGKDGKPARGLGQIIVGIYNNDGAMVARTLTESDGTFSYLGLAPGTYTVRLDAAQLDKLHMTASAMSTPITIRASMEGDLADNVDFKLILQPGAEPKR